MGVRHTETCIKTENEMLAEELAFRSAFKLMFTQQAETGAFTDEVITTHAALLLPWDGVNSYAKGSIRRCPDSGAVFRCAEPPDARARTAPKPPSKAKENWQPIGK